MDTPLVTIGALNYNNSRFLIETLKSIESQTYPNIELIIVDDGSSDDSLSKIKSWLSNYNKPYKLIVHEENKGIHCGYETVIDHSSGEYISLLATDDLITPDKIKDQVESFLSLDKGYGVVYGDVVEIDDSGKEISLPNFTIHKNKKKDWELPEGDVFKWVVKEFLIYIQASLIRSELLKNFRFNLKTLSEDWQLILYLARHSKFYGSDKVCSKYRKHTLSVSARNREQERYYLWSYNNLLMFHEVYGFKKNNKEEKKVIEKRIEFDMFDYAYQSRAKYNKVIQTWGLVTKNMPSVKAYRMLFVIHLLRLKLMLKKIILKW